MTRTHCRRAFTLLEMLVVFWGLAVLMVLGAVLLVGLLRIDQAATDSGERLASRKQLADTFRADVASAAQAPDRLGEREAGPDCLILRVDEDHHVIYRWDRGHLERAEVADQKESARRLPVLPEGTTVHFSKDGDLVVLRLTDPGTRDNPGRELDVAAALGGDRR